jgi:hypothetical protein
MFLEPVKSQSIEGVVGCRVDRIPDLLTNFEAADPKYQPTLKMTVFLKNLDLSKIKDQSKRSTKVNRSQMTSFPVKLFRMLEAVEREGNEHIVSWHPSGRSFQVHNPQKFVEVVLPSYFKQTKYKSFQRQLNFYGFQRITSGPLEGSYKHSSFISGNEALCKEIKRQTQQSTKSGATISNHDQGSDYDSSSESSEVDNMVTEKESLADMSIFDEKQSNTTTCSQEAPSRRDSYHTAMEMLENSVPASNGSRDSFHYAIDTISAFESKRRGGCAEGTRLSFVGKKFHFLPTTCSQEAPSRRDSYHMAMEMLENSVPASNGSRDSFHYAIDTISAFESKRRGGFAEGTRLSFVGKKFHFLPVEFTDLYGV